MRHIIWILCALAFVLNAAWNDALGKDNALSELPAPKSVAKDAKTVEIPEKAHKSDSVSAVETKDIRDISVSDAARVIREKPDGLVILDVRTPGEYAAGHIAGAKNFDFFGPKFEKQIESLPRESEILLYCRSGRRSAGALEILGENGFKKIMHMNQGFTAWEKAGLPVEKSVKK